MTFSCVELEIVNLCLCRCVCVYVCVCIKSFVSNTQQVSIPEEGRDYNFKTLELFGYSIWNLKDQCPKNFLKTDHVHLFHNYPATSSFTWGSTAMQRCIVQPSKSKWMLGSEVTTQLKWLLPAREGGEWRGKVPCIQKKMVDVVFRLSYNSFTNICSHANLFSFSFVDRKKHVKL